MHQSLVNNTVIERLRVHITITKFILCTS